MDDVTLFSLFQDLLQGLQVSRNTLVRYELFYRIAYKLFALLIGIFAVINTVLVFTTDTTNPIVHKVFMCLNLLFTSGLLGNFGGKAVVTQNEIKNIDFVATSLVHSRASLGLCMLPPPSMIVDTHFPAVGGMPLRLLPLQRIAPYHTPIFPLLQDTTLRAQIMNLECIIHTRVPSP